MQLSNIQILRGVAALFVVIFHAGVSERTFGFTSVVGEIYRPFGASGVDCFFVISGFIMIYVQQHKKRSAAKFLKKRLKRIVPLYWFHLTIYILGSSH